MAFRLSARAGRDLADILEYSLEHHGRDAADRYRLLLLIAIEDIGNDPLRRGSRIVAPKPGVRCFSISHSRMRQKRHARVASPAHQLIYRVAGDGNVDILAVIGDSYPAARIHAPE